MSVLRRRGIARSRIAWIAGRPTGRWHHLRQVRSHPGGLGCQHHSRCHDRGDARRLERTRSRSRSPGWWCT